MLKIQYVIAGFFAGSFTGLLLALPESRIIDADKHPALLFVVVALTIIICGITGMIQGKKISEKKTK